VSAKVVLLGGKIRIVSEESNPEIFHAVKRGASHQVGDSSLFLYNDVILRRERRLYQLYSHSKQPHPATQMLETPKDDSSDFMYPETISWPLSCPSLVSLFVFLHTTNNNQQLYFECLQQPAT
jgi:hypothetical protein